jgi:streptogramin lyase
MNEFPAPHANAFPGAITLGPDNNIWVAEIGTSFVDRIAPNGSFTGSFKLPNQPATNLAAGPNGNVLFTTISGVGILDPRVSTPPPVFPSAFRPSGIALGHDGNIWYSETNVVDLGSGPGDVVAINRQGQQILKAPVDLFSQAPAQIFNGPGDMLWFMLNGHAARLVVA